VREQWAVQQRALLSARGTLLTCVFPVCEKVGGPPYAMSVPLVRNLLEPLGLRASTVREDLTEAECHRPGNSMPLGNSMQPGTALIAFQNVGAS